MKSLILLSMVAISIQFGSAVATFAGDHQGQVSSAAACPAPPPDLFTLMTEIDAIPADAPLTGPLIAVDTSNNTLYFFLDRKLVAKAPAATGSEKYMKRGLQEWQFHTPRGRWPVVQKIVDPVWVKPDWAYIEEGKKPPPSNSRARRVQGHLGAYALNLGEGIMIHGTDEPSSVGHKVTHGCIRLGSRMLSLVYRNVSVGTPVYIF